MSQPQRKVSVTVHFEEQDDGNIVAWAPDLPECVSDGDTMEEAKKRILEAIALYTEDLEALADRLDERYRGAA